MYAILWGRHVRMYTYDAHVCSLPFAFSVHLVLRKGDVLMVEVDTELRGDLADVLIGSPL